jgi:hypothetical protein
VNDGYLDAECVINFLLGINFIKNREWKHSNKIVQELVYPISFFMQKHNACISFSIYVFNTTHCIMKSSIRILAAKYNEDLSPVFERCVL